MDPLTLLDKLTALSSSGFQDSGIFQTVVTFLILYSTLQLVVETGKKIWASLTNRLEPSSGKGVSKNTIMERLSVDGMIDSILGSLVDTENIGRAILFQFHNGIVMKSGMPFEYVVITHEVCAPGIAPSTLNERHHDMRIFSELINKIINGDVCTMETSKFNEPIHSIFAENGDLGISVKIIDDLVHKNNTIGFIMCTNEKTELFKDYMEEQITESAAQIAGILSNSWGLCDNCEKYKTCKDKKNLTGCRCDKMVPKFKPNIKSK